MRNGTLSAGAALLAGLLATAAHAQTSSTPGCPYEPPNLVGNQNFECDQPLNTADLHPGVSNWTVSSNPGMQIGETSLFDPGLPNHNYLAFCNTQATTGGPAVGTATQMIATIPGQVYTFAFEYSTDGMVIPQGKGGTEFTARFGNQTVVDIANAAPAADWATYTRQGYYVLATSNRTPITFTAKVNAPGHCVGLDDVHVDPTEINVPTN